MILRAEKGFIVIGKDTDGTTMPHDLGVDGSARIRGRTNISASALLFMPVATDPRRKQLVGLSVGSGETPLPTGAHVTAGAGRARRSQGYVTSSYIEPDASAARSRLASSKRACRASAKRSASTHLGAERRATIVNPVALDPEGKRLHA